MTIAVLQLVGDSSSGDVFGVIILAPLVIAAYFLPTIIAYRRKHAYTMIIFGLNVFAFTGFFWLGAFVWAVWPSEQSLMDPIAGNVTGTGLRNIGDTVGAIKYGVNRGENDEHLKTVRMRSGQQPNSPAPASASLPMGTLEQLGRLAKLHSDGVLSDEEFQSMKSQLIGPIETRAVSPPIAAGGMVVAGSRIHGTVVRAGSFGAVLELAPSVEGTLSLTDLAPLNAGQPVKNALAVVQIGQVILVEVGEGSIVGGFRLKIVQT